MFNETIVIILIIVVKRWIYIFLMFLRIVYEKNINMIYYIDILIPADYLYW